MFQEQARQILELESLSLLPLASWHYPSLHSHVSSSLFHIILGLRALSFAFSFLTFLPNKGQRHELQRKCLSLLCGAFILSWTVCLLALCVSCRCWGENTLRVSASLLPSFDSLVPSLLSFSFLPLSLSSHGSVIFALSALRFHLPLPLALSCFLLLLVFPHFFR